MTFPIMHLFPNSSEGKATPTLLGPLDRADLIYAG
jgi:hypothetical protein